MHLHRPRTATSNRLAPDSTGTFAAFIAVLAMIVMLWGVRAEASVNAQDGDGWVTREVEGVGASLVEAKTDAVLTALRLIVGEFVRTEVKITGDTAEELIIAFSTADGVKSEQVGDPSFTNEGQVRVKMRVSVKPRQLVEMFEKEAQSAVFIDGETLAAEVAAARMNLQAQQTLLRKLFTDLPVKLLVARLVDRDGKPITDGRPDPKDVKPLGVAEVGIALNIEIYFDLPSYYEKVVPNLMLALGAIASNQGQVDWAMNDWRRAGSSEGSAIRNWPSGYPWASYSPAPTINPRLEPSDRVIAVSIGRDRFGQQETFQAYVVPDVLSTEIERATASIRQAVMVCSLLDAKGSVIRQVRLALNNITPYVLGDGKSGFGPAGFEVGNATSLRFSSAWSIENPAPSASRGPWMAPRFYSNWSSGFLSDILATRIALSLPSSEFERLAGIAFDFETADAVNRQLEGRR